MIAEVLIKYMFDRRFLLQTIATLSTYVTLRVATTFLLRKKRYNLFKYYGIPGPEPNIIEGNLGVFLGNPMKANEELQKKYGKVYGYFIGDSPVIVVTDLEILRKIFFEEMKYFNRRTRVFIENSLTKGILFAQYNRWKLMRKIMSGSFSQYTIRGDSSTQFIETSLKMMLDYIDTKLMEAKSSNKEADIDIHSLMKSTALHLISNMAVNLPDVKVQEDEDNVKSLDSYLKMADQSIVIFAIRFPFIKPFIQFLENHLEHNKTLALIHHGLNKNIDDTVARLAKGSELSSQEQANIMTTLIKLYHEGVLTRDEVIGNAEALLFAGYDTTSTTLAYLIWVVSKYPDVQQKLRQELMAHGVDSKYLLQVINETMRLYPTVVTFTTRLASETLQLDELVIPRGAQVVYNAWLLHRDPEHWPDPLKFDPERFREGTTIHPCAFAPFGLGDRKCIGYQLAILELKMVLCDLLLRYSFKLKSPQELELVSYAFSLTKPREKVLVEVQRLSDD